MDRGHLDSVIDRAFAKPLNAISEWVGAPGSNVARRTRQPLPRTKTVGGLD
jgi:hypothetical protein